MELFQHLPIPFFIWFFHTTTQFQTLFARNNVWKRFHPSSYACLPVHHVGDSFGKPCPSAPLLALCCTVLHQAAVLRIGTNACHPAVPPEKGKYKHWSGRRRVATRLSALRTSGDAGLIFQVPEQPDITERGRGRTRRANLIMTWIWKEKKCVCTKI